MVASPITMDGKINEDTPRSTIILALISATMIWTLVYFISFMIRPNKSAQWHSLMVCLIHGTVITCLSYIVQVRKDQWPLSHPCKFITFSFYNFALHVRCHHVNVRAQDKYRHSVPRNVCGVVRFSEKMMRWRWGYQLQI